MVGALVWGFGCAAPRLVWNDTLQITNEDLLPLEDHLNALIADGSLRWIRTGENVYPITLPGAAGVYPWTIVLTPKTVIVPFGFATAWITQLEFESARLRWNPRQRALELKLRIRDNQPGEAGIAADVTVFGRRQRMEFAVTGASFTLWLRPRRDAFGEIVFDPIEFRLAVNTDDAIPEVRQPLREALEQLRQELQAQVRQQFRDYRPQLETWVRGLRPPGTHLAGLSLDSGGLVAPLGIGLLFPDLDDDRQITLQDLVRVAVQYGRRSPVAEPLPEDVTGDGWVDLRDLVQVARMMGQSR